MSGEGAEDVLNQEDLENAPDETDELGLIGVEEIESEVEDDLPSFEMQDIDIEEIESSRRLDYKEKVLDTASKIEDKELFTGKQTTALGLGGLGLQLWTLPNINPAFWLGSATGGLAGAATAYRIWFDDTAEDEGIFSVGDIVPSLDNYVDSEPLDRDYQATDVSFKELFEDSEKVLVGQKELDPIDASDWYEDLLIEYNENSALRDNNMQLLAYMENGQLWEYRIEIKTSESSGESFRGLTEENPQTYLRGDEVEVDYEAVKEITEI